MENYDMFYKHLKDPYYKQELERILENLITEKSEVIRNEIQIDRKHMEMVNYCVNLFLPHAYLYNETEYKLLVYEPFIHLHEKNFDIAVYNPNEKILLLIDCKSSYSNPRDKIKELKELIEKTNKKKNEYKELIGDEISYIEIIFCLPTNDGIELGYVIYENNIPICVWCYDAFKNEIKLFEHPSESSDTSLFQGRRHRNNKLSRFLYKGVNAEIKSTRTYPILPSSHICSILIHATISIVTEKNLIQNWDGNFEYEDIYKILKNSIANPNTLTNDNVKELALKVINTGIKKNIFYDSTESIIEIEKKQFRLKNKLTSQRVENQVKTNYIELNALKLAKQNAIEKFKDETGWKDLTQFFKK